MKEDRSKTILLRCACYDYHFVEIYQDPEWGDSVWITHIERPRRLWQRFVAVWNILRGKNIFDGELMIVKEDYQKLAEFFAKEEKK